jgi:hypothetical protein
MTTKTRRRIHIALAIFFAIQVPIAIWLQITNEALFNKIWVQYLVFLSLYAIVSTHWAGASADTPNDDDDSPEH